jgi:hypothetical protein
MKTIINSLMNKKLDADTMSLNPPLQPSKEECEHIWTKNYPSQCLKCKVLFGSLRFKPSKEEELEKTATEAWITEKAERLSVLTDLQALIRSLLQTKEQYISDKWHKAGWKDGRESIKKEMGVAIASYSPLSVKQTKDIVSLIKEL